MHGTILLSTIFGFSLLVVQGCATERFAAPSPSWAVPETEPPDLTDVKVALRLFQTTNGSEADHEKDSARELERAFMGYLINRASFGLVLGPSVRPTGDVVQLSVVVAVEEDTSHTFILDAISAYPFLGLFPFVPSWGQALVHARMRIHANGVEEPPIEATVEAPFSVLFYSWYRTGPVEDAFRRAHDAAFRAILDRLVERLAAAKTKRLEAARLAALRDTSTSSVTGTSTVARPTRSATTALARSGPARGPSPWPALSSGLGQYWNDENVEGRLETPPIHLPPEGVNVVVEPFRRGPGDLGLFGRWLSALGGLEGSITGGIANVESSAVTARGGHEVVGAGEARSHGYRVALYQPPDQTGFFFPPALGFLSQIIDISGFRQNTPILTDPSIIPAVVTDPRTGAPADLGAPVVYNLKLQSGYFGQGIGLNMVIGTEDVQLFGTARASINLIEYRSSDFTINEHHGHDQRFAFFQSGGAGAQLGLALRPLHLAVRAAFEVSWYNHFDYPTPLEFLSSYAYNPDKRVYERIPVSVDGATLQTFDWQLSVIALF